MPKIDKQHFRLFMDNGPAKEIWALRLLLQLDDCYTA